MNTDMKALVEELLKTYSDRKQEIEVLRYGLSYPASVTPDEQIAAMHSPTTMEWASPAATSPIGPCILPLTIRRTEKSKSGDDGTAHR